MGRGEPPARLPELHSHHFPDKGITRRSCCSSQGARKRRHRGCSMAACLQRGWLPSLLPAILLSLHSPPSAPEPVTSQDAALLAGVPEDILCFSRSFEDLTCFWDEEEEAAASGMCQFYYWYSRDVPTACTVSTWRHGTGGTRHVCVFPSQDVQLFTQLHLHVLDTTTNQTKYWREISVDAVGPGGDKMGAAAGGQRARHVPCRSHRPPVEHHSPLGWGCGAALRVMAATARRLPKLLPLRGAVLPCQLPRDVLQHHVGPQWAAPGRPLRPPRSQHPRTHGWGSRSLPRSGAGDIGLCCSTPDLQHVRCKWIWDPTEPHSSHQLFYRPPLSGAGTREDAWQQCEEVSVGAQGTHTCTFQPRAGSAISVLVNITRPHALPTLSYFKESFWLHQAVLTDAPQLVQAMVSQGQLSLEWLPPLEALAEQLDYQVRYAVENSHDWKVLQVPQASRKEVLDLRPGARYHAQVRAQPSGPWYRGSWSAWSEPVMVDVTDDAGWIIPSVTVVPLLFTGVLLGLRCTFPSLYSNVKQKLWPPVPDLHRALGSFLHESSKHGQANSFYKQPPEEEAVLPCLLEVLPGPRGEAGPPPEPAAGRLSGTDIANQSYLLMNGWDPRGPP
ncbi:thrombopoietin receptor isoform X6 [Rissa tridactyla]|uniref:thrombopoietin receptor isoform X6 n=1 Tax=Rissa tridactyla TaxID=75485 RepID=UPI0023BB065D|nr:thrombopoietin receptor isoform X6 [Rissa tridactyla]